MKRYQIVEQCVRRWCRFFDLPPFFWVRPGKRADIGSDSDRLQAFGTAEDRMDCVAMIVGTLTAKGFSRSPVNNEMSDYLQMSSTAIHHYLQHYKSIPNETRKMLLMIDGEKAPDFYYSIVADAKAESLERLNNTRKAMRKGRMNG